MFALLFQALFPALVRAAPKSTGLTEICTAFGIKKTAVDGAGPSLQQHCPVCALAGLAALPSAPVQWSPAGCKSHIEVLPQPGRLSFFIRLTPYLRGPPQA